MVGPPDDNEEDEELVKLRSSTNATDGSDSVPGEEGSDGVPRLSTSQSLADFISRVK